jgi:hypothetical protein
VLSQSLKTVVLRQRGEGAVIARCRKGFTTKVVSCNVVGQFSLAERLDGLCSSTRGCMTFQLSLSNGARWRLIEINGVLFAVLKCRVLQKRHRPPHDKTSGLSSDTALYPHEYKNLNGNSR